jgi:hypothetical protein
MTTTQKAFNNIENRINELTAMVPYSFNFGYYPSDIKNIIASLEVKLAEIAMELTAERHEANY